MKRPVAAIAGTGRGVPAHVMTNHDFAAIGIETSHEWIFERSGIVERRIARNGETTCSMASDAARKAMERRRRASRRDRRDRPQHRDARPAASGDGRRHSGGARRDARRGIRRRRRVLWLALRDDHRRRTDHVGHGRDGAGDRLGEDERDRGLDRTGRRACFSATAPAPPCSSAAKQRKGNSVRVHAQRRQARRSAVSTRRRRDDADVRGGARGALAPRADGRPRSVQARRAVDGRCRRPRARRRAADRLGHRSADPAPGERPHHRGDGEARRTSRWTRST